MVEPVDNNGFRGSGGSSAADTNAEIAIQGMTCAACTSAVTNALENVPGVKTVNVSLITERAQVTFSGTDPKDLVTSVEDAGFDAQLLQIRANEHSSVPAEGVRRLQIAVEGMTCGNCTGSVREAVEKLGVEFVEVSLATETVYIKHLHTDASFANKVIDAIEDAGFGARVLVDAAEKPAVEASSLQVDKMAHLELRVFGINSLEALQHAERVINELNGVSAFIDPQTETAFIEYDRSTWGVRAIVKHIENAGFQAIVAATADNSQQLQSLNRAKALQTYRKGAMTAFILGVPCIFLLKLRNYMPHFLVAKAFRGVWVDDFLCILLVLPILLGPARGFYSKSYKAIRARAPTMDVLVTASVTCAFTYSALALVHSIWVDMDQHQMYLWDACAMILMFVLLGKYLENVARGHTSRALSELISLVPETALVVAPDTSDAGELMATDMLQVDDVVIVKPGERVSADGTVTEGESYVTEAMITGESKPVHKTVGDNVVGGTINGLGTLRFRITSCGADTKISQIVDFIKEAQASRAPIQRYADYAAARFVPAILLLALFTFSSWMILGAVLGKMNLPHMFRHHSLFFMSLRLGIAVIVVACPCALGLATPTAVMVGTGVGARHGILVKGGGVFELGAHASVVLFDKTGTLTTGHMSVVATTVPAEYWPLVRALEVSSEHPAGKALSQYYHPDEQLSKASHANASEPQRAENVAVLPGEGITGTVNNESIFIGRRSSAGDDGISVIINDRTVGSIVLQDSLRSDAPAVVEALKLQGMIVGIVSGDNSVAVKSISRELGIDDDHAWSLMKPEDKVNVIESLKAEGHEVIFVGDGINDTPALVAASVGISLEGATHVAVESADIVLTQMSPIAAVPAALDLCRATMHRIKVNLLASVVYNAVMVPFAMGLLLPFNIMLSPMVASAAMACSSVSVVVSSLWLKRWQPTLLDFDVRSPSLWDRFLGLIPGRSRTAQYSPV